MESRTITQIKIYKLILNPMRANTEDGRIVALSYYKDQLIDWYNNQFASEPWKDTGENSFPAKGDLGGYSNPSHTWYKVFKKDSPLEWFNRCDLETTSHYGQGISEDWVTQDVAINFVENSMNSVHFVGNIHELVVEERVN